MQYSATLVWFHETRDNLRLGSGMEGLELGIRVWEELGYILITSET